MVSKKYLKMLTPAPSRRRRIQEIIYNKIISPKLKRRLRKAVKKTATWCTPLSASVLCYTLCKNLVLHLVSALGATPCVSTWCYTLCRRARIVAFWLKFFDPYFGPYIKNKKTSNFFFIPNNQHTKFHQNRRWSCQIFF